MSYAEIRPGHPDSFRMLCEELKAAERAGFDYFSLAEHHQAEQGEFSSPLAWACALATQTTRIQIGITLALLPLYHPVRLAEEAAIADIISSGRFFLGIGLGYQPRDFSAFGVPMADRVGRYREAVQILKQAWEHDSVTFHGKHFTLDDVRITPRPLQPRIPLWGGGNVAASARRAAECDAWLSGTRTPADELQALSQVYCDAAETRGKSPRVILCRNAWIADSLEEAWAEYGPAMAAQQNAVGRMEGTVVPLPADQPLPLNRPGQGSMLIGAPAEIMRQIDWYRDNCRTDTLILRLRTAFGPNQDLVLGAIERFGRDVIAQYRQADPAAS